MDVTILSSESKRLREHESPVNKQYSRLVEGCSHALVLFSCVRGYETGGWECLSAGQFGIGPYSRPITNSTQPPVHSAWNGWPGYAFMKVEESSSSTICFTKPFRPDTDLDIHAVLTL